MGTKCRLESPTLYLYSLFFSTAFASFQAVRLYLNKFGKYFSPLNKRRAYRRTLLIGLRRCRIFDTLKVCGHPMSSTSLRAIFPIAFCVSVSRWQFSQYFKLFHHYHICHWDLWSVIFDVASTTCWRLRSWLAFFSNKIFFNEGFQTQYSCTLNRLKYKRNFS